VGTLDGANVEIRREVGPENFFLFGLDTAEVSALRSSGYHPGGYIGKSPALEEAIGLVESGFFSYGERDRFRAIVDNVRHDDPYMICADFDAYRACKQHAADVYCDRRAWARRAVFNIAGASRFSSDHTVRQYATAIWGIEPVKVDVRLLGDGD